MYRVPETDFRQGVEVDWVKVDGKVVYTILPESQLFSS